MEENNKKMVLGLVIGGLVGAGALYWIQAAKNRRTPVLKKIGRTISEVGEMLENYTMEKAHDVKETIEEKVPHGENIIKNVTDWVDSGMNLWKKFNKG